MSRTMSRPNTWILKVSLVLFVQSSVPRKILSWSTNLDILLLICIKMDHEIFGLIDKDYWCVAVSTLWLFYSKQTRDDKSHWVEHVVSGGATCQCCGRTCPTRHALQMHVIRQLEIIIWPFSLNSCKLSFVILNKACLILFNIKIVSRLFWSWYDDWIRNYQAGNKLLPVCWMWISIKIKIYCLQPHWVKAYKAWRRHLRYMWEDVCNQTRL